MAAYPSIGLQYDLQPINGPRLDLSVSGTVRGINLADTTVYRVRITHPMVTSAEKDTLEAFYDANKLADNTITLGGTGYTLKFETPFQVRSVSATYFELSTTLVGSET